MLAVMELAPSESFSDVRLGTDLLWRDVRVPPFPQPVPAMFLDRDGVIIAETGYISKPEHVALQPGIPDLIRSARKLGMAVVEVTNQAGIGRGYFGWPEFIRVESRVAEVLWEHGVSVDAVFACPFHSEGCPPYRHPGHPWRKPNAGMLLEAASLLHLDLLRSVLVGDRAADLQAACAAGLAGGIHVLTGYGKEDEVAVSSFGSSVFSVRIASSANEAIQILDELTACHRKGQSEAGQTTGSEQHQSG